MQYLFFYGCMYLSKKKITRFKILKYGQKQLNFKKNEKSRPKTKSNQKNRPKNFPKSNFLFFSWNLFEKTDKNSILHGFFGILKSLKNESKNVKKQVSQ